MNLIEYVGGRIRDLRTKYAGRGLSQEALAKSMGVATNTVSRWETATYRPTLEDLEKLSRFFGVSVLEFFPHEEETKNDEVAALLRAAKQLDPKDLAELRRYAEFRRARQFYKDGTRSRSARKRNRS